MKFLVVSFLAAGLAVPAFAASTVSQIDCKGTFSQGKLNGKKVSASVKLNQAKATVKGNVKTLSESPFTLDVEGAAAVLTSSVSVREIQFGGIKTGLHHNFIVDLGNGEELVVNTSNPAIKIAVGHIKYDGSVARKMRCELK